MLLLVYIQQRRKKMITVTQKIQNAAIDQPIHLFSFPTQEIKNNWINYVNRLKKLRKNPPNHWLRVINILNDGGELHEPKTNQTSYLLLDNRNNYVGYVRKSTITELFDTGIIINCN